MTVTGRRGNGSLLKTEETTSGGLSVIAVDMALQNFEQKAESIRPKQPPN